MATWSFFYWLLSVLDVSLILFVIPFYLSYGNVVGTLLSVILFLVVHGAEFCTPVLLGSLSFHAW